MTSVVDRRLPRALVGAAAAAGFVVHAADLHAQSSWNFTPSLGGQATYTNNVDLQPNDQREGDFIFTVTPGFSVDHAGPRTILRGSVSLPIALYARTGERNNEVRPSANLFGRAEFVKDFFFVEASADVSQTYLNPFGARPDGIDNETGNRYTAQSYRVTPYIQGVIGSDISYSLRDDNLWTQFDNAPVSSQGIYTNRLTGTINRRPTPLGWGADLQRTEYHFPDQERTQLLELARGRVVYQPDPQVQVFASGGYENNRFTLAENSGAIYGAGLSWRPTERTALDAAWEHRFFGNSYNFAFDHRTALTSWNVRASRNITSYPEQLANLPTGTFLPGILDDILASRIPDPAERAQYIIQYMTDRGLPVVLSNPLAIYSQQIVLQELAGGTIGLLGARNSVFFSVYYSKHQAITGSGDTLPPILDGLINNKQTGGSVLWTYQLTSSTSLSVNGTYSTTESIDRIEATSDQWALRVYLTKPISPKTTAFAGARYQHFESDLASGYREAAVFIGASHRFR